VIRAAMCNFDEAESLRLRGMFKHYADSAGIPSVEAVAFGDFPAFKAEFDEVRSGFYSVALVGIDGLSGDEMSQLGQICASADAPLVVLASADRERAIVSYQMGAQNFMLLPAAYDEFGRAAGNALSVVQSRERPSLAVKSRGSVDNIVLSSITFVETTKNGLVIHLPYEHTVSVRSTVNALFALLADDERFVKAGSSFIVNLDNVRSMGSGSVIFSDGEAIIVPVRARTSLKEAYAAYRVGAK